MTLHLHLKKGALHKTLGIASGKKIPLSRERKATHSGSPLERKRAQFAINARKWHHEDVELNERAAAKQSLIGKLVSKITGKGPASKKRKPANRKVPLVINKNKKMPKGSGSGVVLKSKAKGSLGAQTNSLRKTFGVAPGKRFKNKPIPKGSKRTTTLVREETLQELSKRMLTRYASASHESSMDDIKKFPDRLEGEGRALDRLNGKYLARQKDGKKKRVKYHAESFTNYFKKRRITKDFDQKGDAHIDRGWARQNDAHREYKHWLNRKHAGDMGAADDHKKRSAKWGKEADNHMRMATSYEKRKSQLGKGRFMNVKECQDVFENWMSEGIFGKKTPTEFVPNSYGDEDVHMEPRFPWKDKYGNISPKRKRDMASYKSREGLKSPEHNKAISDKMVARMRSYDASVAKYHKDNPSHGFLPQMKAFGSKHGVSVPSADDIKSNKITHDRLAASSPKKRGRKVNESMLKSFAKYVRGNSRKAALQDKMYDTQFKRAVDNHGKALNFGVTHPGPAGQKMSNRMAKKTADRLSQLGRRLSALKTDKSGNFFMPEWPKSPKELKYMGSK